MNYNYLSLTKCLPYDEIVDGKTLYPQNNNFFKPEIFLSASEFWGFMLCGFCFLLFFLLLLGTAFLIKNPRIFYKDIKICPVK